MFGWIIMIIMYYNELKGVWCEFRLAKWKGIDTHRILKAYELKMVFSTVILWKQNINLHAYILFLGNPPFLQEREYTVCSVNMHTTRWLYKKGSALLFSTSKACSRVSLFCLPANNDMEWLVLLQVHTGWSPDPTFYTHLQINELVLISH